MQVFKLYMKIFRKSMLMPSMLYVFIFLLMSGAAVKNFESGGVAGEKRFEEEKIRVAVIDQDGSQVSEGLKKTLQGTGQLVTLGDESYTGIQDALFFRHAEYICIIPKGFEEALLGGSSPRIEARKIPESSAGVFMDAYINRYMNILEIKMRLSQGDITEALGEAKEEIGRETKVHFISDTSGEGSGYMSGLRYYFIYLSYPIMSIFLMVVPWMILTLRERDIKIRNMCTPVSALRFNFYLLMANIVFALGIFGIFLLGSLWLNKGKAGVDVYMPLVINGISMVIMGLSLAFLLANVQKKSTISAMSTGISLGMCFFGGVFVPQDMLSAAIKKYGVINPLFWYVKVNNILEKTMVLTPAIQREIIYAIGLQLAFALAFMAMAMVVIKKKEI